MNEDLLKPDEVLEYDEEKGNETINNPDYDWCKEETDNVGEEYVKAEG